MTTARVGEGVTVALSDREPSRRRQLAILRRGGRNDVGNRFPVTHGGYARVLADTLDAKVGVIFDALSEDAPLSEDGELPRADTVAVRLLAECLCRLDSVSADLRDHGWQDRRSGAPRPAVELEGRLGRVAGLDASTILALARGESDPEVRRSLLRRAGLLDEGMPDAAATAARATVSIRPSLSHGKISDIEIVDERVEYLLVGARRALESTEAELSAFEHDHASELLTELLAALIESRDRFVNALIELSAADADLAGRASVVAALGRRTGLFGVDALPRLPLSMDARQEMAQAARQVAEDADALIMVPAGMVT